jgi:hypothetical protein
MIIKTKAEKLRDASARYLENNREKVNARNRARYTTDGRWEKQLRDRFDLTAEEYWRMYEKQGGVCKICGKPQCVGTKLDVDHDHVSGKVRGLLCRHCNAGIGMLKDSAGLLLQAVRYLLDAGGSLW